MCAALGQTLFWSYGTYNQWANIIMYVAVAGAVILPSRLAIAWVVATFGSFVLFCTAGPGRVAGYSEWAALGFGILLASALVLTIKRMLVYIRELQATRAKLARIAVSEERLRFSRDLHDLLGHTLSLIVVKAEVARRLAEHDPAAAAHEAAEIEVIGRMALTDVREAVSGYREPDFAIEVNGCRAALMDAGMTVRVTQPEGTLPPPANTLFGWAIREAATNAIRHSGARTCTIAVWAEGDVATLDVTDDGVGGRPSSDGGTGLRGLRERFALVGGAVETSSAPGKGFRLVATVPIAVTES
jgi:two-component system sensor histidine kinase DesK